MLIGKSGSTQNGRGRVAPRVRFGTPNISHIMDSLWKINKRASIIAPRSMDHRSLQRGTDDWKVYSIM
jgi:hypothetical protein